MSKVRDVLHIPLWKAAIVNEFISLLKLPAFYLCFTLFLFYRNTVFVLRNVSISDTAGKGGDRQANVHICKNQLFEIHVHILSLDIWWRCLSGTGIKLCMLLIKYTCLYKRYNLELFNIIIFIHTQVSMSVLYSNFFF